MRFRGDEIVIPGVNLSLNKMGANENSDFRGGREATGIKQGDTN